MKNSSNLSAYEDGTECSETSAYKITQKEAHNIWLKTRDKKLVFLC